jgi:hypothetical protein
MSISIEVDSFSNATPGATGDEINPAPLHLCRRLFAVMFRFAGW